MIINKSLKKKKKKKKKNELVKKLFKKPTKDDMSNFNEWVNKKETGLNYKLFEKHFKFKKPSDMLKSVG